MNLRSYMRGLGLGIMVCAILLSLSNSKRNKLNDAQIKARAAELGMVEEHASVLTSLVDEVKSEENPIDTQPDSDSDLDTSKSLELEENAEKVAAKETADESDTKLEEEKVKDYPTEEPTVKKMVMITVYPGEGSYTISKKLANQGLVESADIFDNYLCQNGYDKRLCTGNYNLMVGDSAENIAKRLTGQ